MTRTPPETQGVTLGPAGHDLARPKQGKESQREDCPIGSALDGR